MNTVNYSYRSLRKTIGYLGLFLPALLVIGNQGIVESSISYYYYTKMSTVFTGILITFGLVLITYRGTDTTIGVFNENNLTSLGGFFALIVALVPTKFNEEINSFYLYYIHDDIVRGWIHNGSAVLFILMMGIIVLLKFGNAPYYRKTYRILGIFILLGLAFTIFAFIKEHKTGVFFGETFSIVFFGIAWLRRGIPKKN